MRSKGAPARSRSIDFQRLAQDFQGLNANDPGTWPLAPRVAVFVGLLVATLVAFWWFDWREQAETLARSEAEEVQLREEWMNKKRQAVNLDLHRQQLAEIDRQFGALLKQLPNRAEMDSLLQDINQAGLGRGLQFELFKPAGGESQREFYAELPITNKVIGTYHDMGAFASDVGQLSRIVTLNDVSIATGKDGVLTMDATARTFRYLDDAEVAAQRRSASAKKGGKR